MILCERAILGFDMWQIRDRGFAHQECKDENDGDYANKEIVGKILC